MYEGQSIAVVMPAYNESKLIGDTVDRIPRFVDHLIVVDDGSSDGTSRIARHRRDGVDLLQHGRNRGVGASLATGCLHALEISADLVVIMAADGQMDPVDVPSLLTPLIEGTADCVKGNRLDWPAAQKRMPRSRWLGNHVFSWATRLALGCEVRDSQCGFVAMNRSALRAVRWNTLWNGYGYPNDLLSQLTLSGVRIREVVVKPIYRDEQSGIRLHHVAFVIPFVIGRAWLRRQGAIDAPWPTSTSSTAMPTEYARSPSSATPTPGRAL